MVYGTIACLALKLSTAKSLILHDIQNEFLDTSPAESGHQRSYRQVKNRADMDRSDHAGAARAAEVVYG